MSWGWYRPWSYFWSGWYRCWKIFESVATAWTSLLCWRTISCHWRRSCKDSLVKYKNRYWQGTAEHCKDEVPMYPKLSEACDRYRRWSSLQEWWMWVKISVNGWAACDVVLQLRCMWNLHFCCGKARWLWQWEPGESLKRRWGDFWRREPGESLESVEEK